MEAKLERGSEILQEAVRFEESEQYEESCNAYRAGLQIYFDYLKECPEEIKNVLRQRIVKLMGRAENVKKKLEELKASNNSSSSSSSNSASNSSTSNGHEPKSHENGITEKKLQTTIHEEISIEEDSIGYGYEKTFGRVLNDQIHTIKVEEPYLRMHQQYFNFIRFCELVVKKCKKLRRIIVITGEAPENKEQNQFISDIKQSLQEHNISLEFNYVPSLHDRKISFSNGWVVKIGRGLHYFKPKRSKFSIGNFDLDLAACHKCTVDRYFIEGFVID